MSPYVAHKVSDIPKNFWRKVVAFFRSLRAKK